jgi:hypothetical protein
MIKNYTNSFLKIVLLLLGFFFSRISDTTAQNVNISGSIVNLKHRFQLGDDGTTGDNPHPRWQFRFGYNNFTYTHVSSGADFGSGTSSTYGPGGRLGGDYVKTITLPSYSNVNASYVRVDMKSWEEDGAFTPCCVTDNTTGNGDGQSGFPCFGACVNADDNCFGWKDISGQINYWNNPPCADYSWYGEYNTGTFLSSYGRGGASSCGGLLSDYDNVNAGSYGINELKLNWNYASPPTLSTLISDVNGNGNPITSCVGVPITLSTNSTTFFHGWSLTRWVKLQYSYNNVLWTDTTINTTAYTTESAFSFSLPTYIGTRYYRVLAYSGCADDFATSGLVATTNTITVVINPPSNPACANAAACFSVYVDPVNGNNITGDGSPQKPFKNLSNALGSVGTYKYIRIAQGTINETTILNIADSLIIEGGYVHDNATHTWKKSANVVTEIIGSGKGTTTVGSRSTGYIIAFSANGKKDWALQDLTIRSASAASSDTIRGGYSSYAVYLNNCSNYSISRCIISSGNGAKGSKGQTGRAGANGSVGTAGTESGGCNDGPTKGGGAGATTYATTAWGNASVGGNGGKGGDAHDEGKIGNGTNGVAGSGGGGALGAFGTPGNYGNNVSAANQPNYVNGGCSNTVKVDGGTGGAGTAGAAGSDATGTATNTELLSTYYVPSLPGTQGGAAKSGGGGGGGSSSSGERGCDGCSFICTCGCVKNAGNGGSGGGKGGEGGEGGLGGWGGGGSFAIYRVNSSTGASLSSLQLSTGTAGAGGDGGDGGAGGTGGAGGAARSACSGDRGTSGAGGKGGDGGVGGKGQTGAVGTSFWMVTDGTGQNDYTGITDGGILPNTTNFNIEFSEDRNNIAGYACPYSEIKLTSNTITTGWDISSGALSLVNDLSPTSSSYNLLLDDTILVYNTVTSNTFHRVDLNSDVYRNFLFTVAKWSTTNITRVAVPVITPSKDSVCTVGGSASFSVSGSYDASNILQREWVVYDSLSGNPKSPLFTSASSSPTFGAFTTAGHYFVRYRERHRCCGWSIPVYSRIIVVPDPSKPVITPTPNVASVCYGTSVSAVVGSGTGGAGCNTVYEYSIDGGAWVSYTSGTSIGSTANSSISIRAVKTCTKSDCTTPLDSVYFWSVIKGTASANFTFYGCPNSIDGLPWANLIAGPQGSGTGVWSINSGPGTITDVNDDNTDISALSNSGGTTQVKWTVSSTSDNGACADVVATLNLTPPALDDSTISIVKNNCEYCTVFNGGAYKFYDDNGNIVAKIEDKNSPSAELALTEICVGLYYNPPSTPTSTDVPTVNTVIHGPQPYLPRRWTIKPVNNTDVTVTLYFTADELAALSSKANIPPSQFSFSGLDLNVTKFPGGGFDVPSGTINFTPPCTGACSPGGEFVPSVFSPHGNGYKAVFDVNSFSTFYVHPNSYPFSPLPVELVLFTGWNENTVNRLQWITASEQNTLKFEIQKNTGNGIWNTIGFKDAAGSSNVRITYNFNDVNPSVGDNYYRLKIIDIDGTFSYTDVISIKLNEAVVNNFSAIYPNPTDGWLNVEIQSTANYDTKIAVYDIVGKKVLDKQYTLVKGVNILKMDFANLSKGAYVIQFNDNKGVNHSSKFIKE